jgi:type I restriction enzyme S subunit
VLVAKDGSYLKHIFVVDEEQDIAILSSIALLRPNGRVHPHVLSLYLLDPAIKSRMAGYVSGVAVPRIVLKDFRKFPVVAPPTNIQERFLHVARPMIRNCQLLMRKNSILRHTRDLLLPKLISGEVDVRFMEIDYGELHGT